MTAGKCKRNEATAEKEDSICRRGGRERLGGEHCYVKSQQQGKSRKAEKILFRFGIKLRRCYRRGLQGEQSL